MTSLEHLIESVTARASRYPAGSRHTDAVVAESARAVNTMNNAALAALAVQHPELLGATVRDVVVQGGRVTPREVLVLAVHNAVCHAILEGDR